MLSVYHSNRLEALFILLCSVRESRPLADPLVPETILVANSGIGRWLNLQIADRSGIAANINYVLPASYVWQLYRSCLDNVPERSAFERSALRLHVLRELDAISSAGDDVWTPLQRYTSASSGSIGDTKRVQLASRIADVFDQYLVYRPQMLLEWETGADSIPGNDFVQRWQPALWRRLVASINEPHRASLWRQFCTLADSGKIDQSLLPSQLHLFNVGLLPPSTLDVLVRLAKIGNNGADRVSLYFLNPSIDYWADLLDMRRAARERLKLSTGVRPLADDQIGNPLLSSLGNSGRMLMKLLGDRSEWVHDEKFFLPTADNSLLAALQADLLHPYREGDQRNQKETIPQQQELDLDGTDQLQGEQLKKLKEKQLKEKQPKENQRDTKQRSRNQQKDSDTSIQLHQCYNPMREVQALHDRLLDRFNADDSLTPADVIVMVPDINRYAPVIEAVFGSIGGEPDRSDRTRYIPWSIADRELVQVSRIVACVQRLIELPSFEFEATGVLGFAAEPAIARRFGFTDKALNTLSEWLRDSGVRRTLTGDKADDSSREYRKIFQNPSPALHSWDFGLRRLLLGRAMPAGSGAVGETLPITRVDGQQAELLSQLLNLLHALEETRTTLSEPHAPSAWADVINDMINRLLLPDEIDTDALVQFRELLVQIDTDAVSAGYTDTMTHATFAEILRGALSGAQRKNHRYLTGRVTFSSMVPLRSVPFRIVCMLGLNDSDFPRQRPNPGFDLMAQHPLPGDRSVRDDDRYLFLEALLSARDELYLSYVYRDPSDNAPREPSVLVSELRDYVEKRYPHLPMRCIEHPLQPFSPKLFDPDQPALHTFASEWAPSDEAPTTATLTETGLAPPLYEQIPVDEFQQFWRNPSRWYCRRVLGIALWRDEQEPQDAEPFEFDALASYQLHSELVELLLQHPSVDKNMASRYLQRSGALPHGGLGELIFSGVFEEAQLLVERIRAEDAVAVSTIDIDISVSGQQLQGRLHNGVNWPDGSIGLMQYHVSALRGHHLTPLWLTHLIGSAAGALTGPSLLLTKDTERRIDAIGQIDALAKLKPWIEGWNTGQRNALPFFAKTSAVLAGAVGGNARSTWLPATYNGPPGESEEEAVRLLYNNIAEIPDRRDVLDWAERLLGDGRLKP